MLRIPEMFESILVLHSFVMKTGLKPKCCSNNEPIHLRTFNEGGIKKGSQRYPDYSSHNF
jgi:hypothetical protein